MTNAELCKHVEGGRRKNLYRYLNKKDRADQWRISETKSQD